MKKTNKPQFIILLYCIHILFHRLFFFFFSLEINALITKLYVSRTSQFYMLKLLK